MYEINENNMLTFEHDKDYLNAENLLINGIIEIPELFINNSNIVSITIKGCRYIGNEAFSDCYRLKELHLDEVLDTIGCQSFSNCYDLKEIDWGDNSNVKHINSFQGSGLTHVELPESVLTIGSSFQSCHDLESIILNSNITSLDKDVFFDNYKLIFIYVSPDIKSIGDSAFLNCKSLKYIKLIDSEDENGLENLNNLEYIGAQAFYGTSSLNTPINLPNLRFIGEEAFSLSGITSFMINEYVDTIEDFAFSKCTKLSKVTLADGLTIGNISNLSKNAFSDTNIDIKESENKSAETKVFQLKF